MLAAAVGPENKAIAERPGVAAITVGTWRRRFAERRLGGLDDGPRSGTPRQSQIGDDEVAALIRRTFEETPADSLHPSLR